MSADKLEQRVADLERYYLMLVEMVRRHDERLDETRAEQSNADVRIAALADAQIRTEDALGRLAGAQARTDAAIAQLTARVEQVVVRVDKLAETVERYITRDGQA